MSHFTVTVLVPADRADDWNNYVTQVLAPYDENDEAFREGSRWDWWVVGGRWRGYFKAIEGTKGVIGEPGAFDNEPSAPEHYDVIRKGDVDWEGMAKVRADKRRAWWAEAQAFDERERQFRFSVEKNDTEESYVRRGCDPSSYALIDLAGNWQERARMGWFGCEMEDQDKVPEGPDWPKFWAQTVGAAPDDALLVLVDCHV